MLAEKEIFTIKEAAQFASVSEKTVHRWIDEKLLPTSRPRGAKRGSRHLIRRADLLALVPEHTKEPS